MNTKPKNLTAGYGLLAIVAILFCLLARPASAQTTYSIIPNPATVSENAGTITFTISRAGGTPAETIYASTTTGEGYANNSDYTGILNQAVSFTSGQTTHTVTVTILNDSIVENNETFGFIVQRNSSDPVTTYLAKRTFTITDEDQVQPPTYTITPNPATVVEGAGTLTFTITRSGSFPAETIYASTTTGEGYANNSDYTGILNQAVTFTSGQATRTVTVTILNDTTMETGETFGFIVQRNSSDPVTTYLAKRTFTITDDDQVQPPTYAITPNPATVVEGAGTLTFIITRSGSFPAETIYASTTTGEGYANNSDYTGILNQAVSFTSGQTTRAVTVTILNDTAIETDEIFGFVVQRNTSDPITTYLAKSTFTIVNDDVAQPPTYVITPNSAIVSEGAGTLTFTITRLGSFPAETIYASTTTGEGYANNSDYTGILNQAVTFTSGQATRTVTVTILNDTTRENNETFGFIVQRNTSDPTSTYLAKSTFTIVDDGGVADYSYASWLPAASANVTIGNRTSSNVRWIVIHTTEGTTASAVQRFQNPAEQASAHYIISRDGSIIQLVHNKDISFGSGNYSYNEKCINIEHERYDTHDVTDVEYAASAALVKWLASQYDVQIFFPGVPNSIAPADSANGTGIIGHRQVPDPSNPTVGGGASHHTDPVNWNWAYYESLFNETYTISVSVSPDAGGSVTGGGTFAAGSSRSVTATPDNGYTFANWTESGTIVSTSPAYDFTVNNDRVLVANFSANPSTPSITSPSPGSALTSSSATFQWTGGAGVTEYFFYVGRSFGTNNLYGQSQGANLSVVVSDLPVDGSALYVRLWWQIEGLWFYSDYTYTASTSVQGPPPVNDAFADRIMVSSSGGATTGSNTSATKEAGEPNHDGNMGGKSDWWSWTAPSNGTVTIDTINSSFDTVLAVYTGAAINNLTLVEANDDDGGGLTSKSSFTVTSGTVYQIAVDGFDGESGNIQLHVTFVASSAPAFFTGIGGAPLLPPSNGQFQFEIHGGSAQMTVQASDDLKNWIDVGTVNLVNGKAVFTDSTAGAHPRRFYRPKP